MRDDEPAVLRVSGEVDFFEKDGLRSSLERVLNAETVIIDFSDASYMDSSAISQVLIFVRSRVRAGRSVPRLVAGPGVARLFEVAGLSTITPVVSSLEEALRL